MQLYIDKENLQSFISNSKDPLYADCTKTMQRQLDLTFNFSKEALKTDEILLKWFSVLTEGVNDTKKEFNEAKFPNRPLKSNSYNSFDLNQLSAIYLINDDKINVLKDKGAILIGDIGEEIEVFKQLFLHHNDYKFDKKLLIGGAEFLSWKHLEKYSFVTSDILVFDPYILSDSSLIESNLTSYLKILCSKIRCTVNIVIYLEFDKMNVEYSSISSEIRKSIKSVTGINPNLTIIKYRKQKNMASAAEHDRTIFTNYFRVYSGDSFNYFDSAGSKITNGREIHYSCFADRENHRLAIDLIQSIQEKLNQIPPEQILGDKKSNFLKFS